MPVEVECKLTYHPEGWTCTIFGPHDETRVTAFYPTEDSARCAGRALAKEWWRSKRRQASTPPEDLTAPEDVRKPPPHIQIYHCGPFENLKDKKPTAGFWLWMYVLTDEGGQRARRKAVKAWANRYSKLHTPHPILEQWRQDGKRPPPIPVYDVRESLAGLYVAAARAGVPRNKEYRRWRARLDKLLKTLPCDIESGYIHTGSIEEATPWALAHIPKPGATSRRGRNEVIKWITLEENPGSGEASVRLEKRIAADLRAEGIPVPTVRKTGRNKQDRHGRLFRLIRETQSKK